ncbi:hypothetical protein Q1695_006511 [Nippostrongylus brasiliensis]|nr:hypothetical protein Q1695_006511 [Nippostrongylus brasiliensis]
MDASSSLDPQQDRRKSVRFSKSNQEYVFATETPGKSATNTSGEECPARLRTDENMLRAPANSSRISVGSQRPLVSATNSNVGMLSISPGTKATVERRNAKIRRLQALQQKRDAGKVPHGSSAIRSPDLATVEKSFVETSFKTSAATAAPQVCEGIYNHEFDTLSFCSTPFHQPPVMGVPAAMMKSRESQASDEGSPLQPAGKISSAIKEMVLASDEDYFMSRDERADRQMEAMAVWCNMVLRSQYEEEGLDITNSKQEANKMLQDLLTKTKSGKCPSPIENKPFKYSDFLNRQKRDIMRERALQLLHSSKVPDLLRTAVENKTISIRANCSVYSEISLQTTLLRLFLSFHPAWLHLGLETVFNTTIEMRSDDVFVQVISRFIAQRLFMDPKILKNKKFAFGSGRPIVTDAGREVLHAHFLYHTALFCYFVEIAKASSIIKHNPRMFTRGSFFKSIDDVFAELSREVLSGTGMSLNKAFAKMGFKPTYKQGFADDYNYSVKTFADLTDGVILSKLVELVTECEPGFIINRLRDPCGDRLRKVGNVKTCLQVAIDKGVDVAGEPFC